MLTPYQEWFCGLPDTLPELKISLVKVETLPLVKSWQVLRGEALEHPAHRKASGVQSPSHISKGPVVSV